MEAIYVHRMRLTERAQPRPRWIMLCYNGSPMIVTAHEVPTYQPGLDRWMPEILALIWFSHFTGLQKDNYLDWAYGGFLRASLRHLESSSVFG